MDLKEYILPENTFIGGWYIPFNLCDEIIKIFKDHPKNQAPGVVGPPLRVDPKEKESTEIAIDPKYNDPSFIIYRKYLERVIHQYEEKYPEIKKFQKFGMVESPQIQYYKPGEGFKVWHFEREDKTNRCLVFMTFLNDVPKGGTHFKYQNLTIPAEKGLTLIWPPDFTHTHKGQITKQHEKYILTGWLGYI
jgi:prolyl 4-hydroxylase